MRFSIITITYNAEKFLTQTLESVACQEGDLFEHILWDGGSKDRTLEIASTFPHVKMIQGKDQGIADAMNRASEHAQGDFLLYLHADDYLAHSKVLLMIDRIVNLHPSFEWIYGRAQIVDQNGHFLRMTPYEHFSLKRLKKYNFLTHPATFVSRTLFEKAGKFDVNLRYCMDYDLWLRLAQQTRPLAVHSQLAVFREHLDSLSTKEPLQVTDEAYHVRSLHPQSYYDRFRSYRTWKKRRKYD